MSGAVCKEELCANKAQAAIETGHAYTKMGAWTEEELTQWIALLDHFLAKTEKCFSGPVARDDRKQVMRTTGTRDAAQG